MNSVLSTFRDAAVDFCAMVENLPELGQRESFQRSLYGLSRLYFCALQIPDIEPSDIDWPEMISSAECSALRRKLSSFFGEKDAYWVVFDPTKQAHPLMGSLSDDLADIWRDVKRGLATLEAHSDSAQTDVQWSWKFSFETHWGRHALGAMKTLHQLYFEQSEPAEILRTTAKSPAEAGPFV